MAGIFQNLIDGCNPSSKAGKTLLTLNALGMVFAAISNTFAASVDKNTSPEDKKFLVPAGAVTGVANIAIYYLMTNKIIKGLEKCASKAVEKMNPETITKNALSYAKKAIDKKQNGFLGTGLFANANLAESMKKNLLKDGLPTDLAKAQYKNKVVAGGSVLGAYTGAVLGCAILTPIIRDVSAYFVQKRMEKNNPEMKNQPYMIYFDPSHLHGNRYARRQPLTLKNYMAFTNSKINNGMKI